MWTPTVPSPSRMPSPGKSPSRSASRADPVAITMRTPGHDLELAAGFLFTEGVIDGPDDLTAIAHVDDPQHPKATPSTPSSPPACPPHVVGLQTAPCSPPALAACAARPIDRLRQTVPPLSSPIAVDPQVLMGMPGSCVRLRTSSRAPADCCGWLVLNNRPAGSQPGGHRTPQRRRQGHRLAPPARRRPRRRSHLAGERPGWLRDYPEGAHGRHQHRRRRRRTLFSRCRAGTKRAACGSSVSPRRPLQSVQ